MPSARPLSGCCQDVAAHCEAHCQLCIVNRPRSSYDQAPYHSLGLCSRSLVVNNAGNCCQGWSAEGKRATKAHVSRHPLAAWPEEALSPWRGRRFFFSGVHTAVWCWWMLETTSGRVILGCGCGYRARWFGVARFSGKAVVSRPVAWNTHMGGAKRTPKRYRLTSIPSLRSDVSFQEMCSSGQVKSRKDDGVPRFWKTEDSSGKPQGATSSSESFVSPGQLQRLEKYQQLQKELAGIDGTFICDLDHWPDSPGPQCGPYFPTLLRHGTIIDLNSGKMQWPVTGFCLLDFMLVMWAAASHGPRQTLSLTTQTA